MLRVPLLVATLVAGALALAAPGAAVAACSPTPTTVLPGQTTTLSAGGCSLLSAPAIVTPPQHGTVTTSHDWRGYVAFDYRPAAGYLGLDRFTWTGDAVGEQTVSVQVVAPQLQCQALSQPYSAPPPFTAKAGQALDGLVSCSNTMGEALLRLEATAERGTVAVGTGGMPLGFTYQPPAGYAGADRIILRVISRIAGRSSAPIDVPVTVEGANRPPVCAPPTTPTVVVPDKAVFWRDLCSDPDGDPLAYGIRHTPGTWGRVGWIVIQPGGVIAYAFSGTDFRGPYTLELVVGDGFSATPFDIPVELRDAGGDAPAPPPPAAPPSAPPPAPPPPKAPVLPAPPEGFVPARGVDLGTDVAVWGPLGGIRLGRRNLPVIAAGCRQACTVRASLQLLRKGGAPVALPDATLQLAAGRKTVLRLRLTTAARLALRRRKRVRAKLALEATPTPGGAPRRDTLRLRVSLPASQR